MDDFLLQVNKPARYIGGEWNASHKNFDAAQVKFALCFPDLYEVGMSNLGLRIIYGLLNNIPGLGCERFFSCALDMENLLRSRRQSIFSLESKRPLREFDLAGFSLGFELNYTNVLNILDLGEIPLEARSRDHTYPLVLGGGACVLNPEPLHEFFDFFVIGEAEEVMPEIIETYRRHQQDYKTARISKEELLFLFSRIAGVYVPCFYTVKYDSDGAIAEFAPRLNDIPAKVKKRFVADLDSAYFPEEWLIPYIQIIHDRISLEVMRGCPNHCRFCQARTMYFPFRERGPQQLLEKACSLYKSTGYEEISLAGLSVSNYTKIWLLLQELVNFFKPKGVSLSLPSIKPRDIAGNFAALIAAIKKTGLTFAPEAATHRLRKVLNKDFSEQDFFTTLSQAYLAGYQHVKLYFMVGLPTETQQDLDGILEFSLRVSGLRRQTHKVPARVNISINQLLAKPHTPLQWLEIQDIASVSAKYDYLRRNVSNRRLHLDFHNLQMGFLEAVLCRGDRRLSQVISSAFKRGARFDAWNEHFSLRLWLEAFSECKIDPNFYLAQQPKERIFAWDFIDTGIGKEWLWDEFNKTIAR